MAQKEIASFIDKYRVSMDTVFIPYSKSRHATDKPAWPSLNWKVTIKVDGRQVIATEYSAGSGHCPASKEEIADRWHRRKRVEYEIENGFATFTECSDDWVRGDKKRPILPALSDVLYSFSMDATAINEASFADWASSLGYDTDSIKANEIWKTCIEIGLKLRAALGEVGFTELQNAAQDY